MSYELGLSQPDYSLLLTVDCCRRRALRECANNSESVMYRYLVVDIEGQIFPFADEASAMKELEEYRDNGNHAWVYDLTQCEQGLSLFQTRALTGV